MNDLMKVLKRCMVKHAYRPKENFANFHSASAQIQVQVIRYCCDGCGHSVYMQTHLGYLLNSLSVRDSICASMLGPRLGVVEWALNRVRCKPVPKRDVAQSG